MSDEAYQRLVELGISNRFFVKDIEPIKQIILPGLQMPEIKKIKNDKRRTKDSK
jgi:hypothetical protein